MKTLVTSLVGRSEEYRAQAAECQGIANRYPDLIKQQYEDLARQWRALADRGNGP